MDKGDPETPKLQDAYQEMQKTVKVIDLALWRQSLDKKDRKDFVSAKIVKAASKSDINRQMCVLCIFWSLTPSGWLIYSPDF